MKQAWPSMTLKDVCQIKPPKSEARQRVSAVGLVSFLPMEDLGIDEKFVQPTRTKPLASVVGSYTYFANGDVLLAKITPCFENGKLGIATGLTNEIGFGSSEYIVFRPNRTLTKEWLYYYLSRETFRIEGATQMSGAVGHKRVSKEFIDSYPIPLPPLPEQQRIVAILDESFKAIDTAKANTKKNLQNARALFESHLNAVFSQGGEEWIENNLQALTTKIGSGATPRGGGKAYKTEGLSLIRSLNIYDTGFHYEKLAFIDEDQANKLSNVEVESQDVLLNITGASITRCCVVPEAVLPARVNQHVSIIRPIRSKIDAEFLHYLLISKPYKDHLLQTGIEGGSTRQAITKSQIQNFKICYPETISDQRTIVTKLNALATQTRHLESIYQKKLAALDELKKSLLHQAFKGNL